MDVALRLLRAEDLDEVKEIEREAFAPLGVGTPFKRELNNRYAKYLVAYAAEPFEPETGNLPVEDSPSEEPSLWARIFKPFQRLSKGAEERFPTAPCRIAGYLGVWFQGNEAHITEIAVREQLRGQGIGELLLIGSVRAAMEYGSSVVTLEARVSNFVAQRLYEKYGFKSAGIRKGYYADNREDAVIMTTSPIHSEEYRELFRELQERYPQRWRQIRVEN